MKKLLVTVIAACMLLAASAQITIIPKAGISLANIEASADISDGDLKSKIGLVIGAGVEFGITDMFTLQPELLFHQKGAKSNYEESFDGSSYTQDYALTLNYLELPVLFKVKFDNFYVNAGPSIGFGIGGKYESDWTYTDPDPSYNESGSESGNVKFGKVPANYQGDDHYYDNGLDFGFQLGAGYKIAGKILIDVRYGLGLSNLVDKDTANDINDNKSQNRSLQFTVGIPISIK